MTALATVESDDYDVWRGLDRPKGEAMRIGELASRTGVSVRALRYYEEQQLLTASRSATGQRLDDDDAVGWVDLIQQLYAAGLSSSTILKLLPCVKEQDPQRSPHSHALLHAERRPHRRADRRPPTNEGHPRQRHPGSRGLRNAQGRRATAHREVAGRVLTNSHGSSLLIRDRGVGSCRRADGGVSGRLGETKAHSGSSCPIVERLPVDRKCPRRQPTPRSRSRRLTIPDRSAIAMSRWNDLYPPAGAARATRPVAQSIAYCVVIEFPRPEGISGPVIDGEDEFRVFGDME